MRLADWFRRRKLAGRTGRRPVVPAFVVPIEPAPHTSREWRQGDVFELEEIAVVGSDGRLASVACTDGVAVISQSCDASQTGRPMLQVAPVVRLNEIVGEEVRAGRRPRYAALPALGPDVFADLDFVMTIAKASLEHHQRRVGVETDEAVRSLAGAISRKFGRFAFPDPVAECMEPVRKNLASKAANPRSPLGQVLSEVYALRVEATTGWTAPPYAVQLIVVVHPGQLQPEDDMPEEPSALRDRCSDPAGRLLPSLIADVIVASADPDEKHWAWVYLAEAWVEQCNLEAAKAGMDQVVSFGSEVVTVDEFPLSRVNNSEALDLDYASEPLPRAL